MQPVILARLFVVCIAVRTLLAAAFVATGWAPSWARVLAGSVAAVLAVNFLVASFRGKELGAFGEPAWWAPLRPMHAAAWAMAAVLLFGGVRYGGALAVIDPIMGVVSYATLRASYYRNAAPAAAPTEPLLF